MRVEIHGRDLPGRHFTSEGRPLANVHVAVQERREPVGLVAGDAPAASGAVEVQVARLDDGSLDFRGPAVQGKRGERFLYLTWGDVAEPGAFSMFRRAKLMLGRVDPALVLAADAGDAVLVADVSLTDERGGPRCARVDPPAIAWSVR